MTLSPGTWEETEKEKEVRDCFYGSRACEVTSVVSESLQPRGPWTVAFQAPLSMGFPRQEDWSGCPALLQVIFPTQGFNRHLMSPALAGRFFTTRATGEAPFMGVETLGIVLLQVIQVISLQSPAPKSGVKRFKAALSVSYPIRVCVLRYLTQLRTYDLPL